MKRGLILAAVALLLAGCEHMYAGTDIALTDSDAIRIARQYALRHNIPLKGLKPGVARFDTGISVTFGDPACEATCIDGLPILFFIKPGQHRISHFQDGRV